MINKNLFVLLFLLVFIFVNGQELDTLFYFSPDDVQECAYIGDLTDLGVKFVPDPSWGHYDIVALEIQHLDTTILNEQPITFYLEKDSFPGAFHDTLWVSTPDSSDLYPEWVSYDLSDRQSLKFLLGPFSVTGKPLLTFLCDFSTPSGNSWGYSHQQQLWKPTGDFPVRAIVKQVVSSIEDEGVVPANIEITDLFPNPFNPELNISFHVHEKTQIDIMMYNAVGQKVATLGTEYRGIGNHKVTWQPYGLESGVYLVVLRADGTQRIKKCLLLK